MITNALETIRRCKTKRNTMNSNRKAAAVAGWLYVLGFVTGILSVAYAVDAPDYLLKAAAIPGAGQTARFHL
jgi:hypothetical protein